MPASPRWGEVRVGGRSGVGAAGLGLGAARAPQAHEPRDERDEEDLPDEHLEHGERLPHRPGRNQVAVAGRRQRRVAEEEVVAGARVRNAGEELGVAPATERYIEEGKQQAEQREDADRSEDRSKVDPDRTDDASEDRDGGDRSRARKVGIGESSKRDGVDQARPQDRSIRRLTRLHTQQKGPTDGRPATRTRRLPG